MNVYCIFLLYECLPSFFGYMNVYHILSVYCYMNVYHIFRLYECLSYFSVIWMFIVLFCYMNVCLFIVIWMFIIFFGYMNDYPFSAIWMFIVFFCYMNVYLFIVIWMFIIFFCYMNNYPFSAVWMFIVFSSLISPKARSAASIILRGANDYYCDEMERSIHDSLCVVRRVLESKTVVPGGGAVEAALSIYLENYATSLVSVILVVCVVL